MTSTDIHDRLTELQGELHAKQRRLAELPAEKSRTLDDEKMLTRIEREEAELAATLARLESRLPLLRQGLEAAQKEEASARLGIIQKEWGGSLPK